MRSRAIPCGINSSIFVQESKKRRSEHGWNGERLLVILSEAKDLVAQRARSFASLRMTLGRPIRLSTSDEPMMQYVGINVLADARLSILSSELGTQ
jgi:hypothetical protein